MNFIATDVTLSHLFTGAAGRVSLLAKSNALAGALLVPGQLLLPALCCHAPVEKCLFCEAPLSSQP
jgi:hypothetical protein